MILKQLTLNNFGPYAGSQVMELGPKDKKRRITLIGAMNGHGKTTLLDSLQLVLYGQRATLSNRKERSWEKYLGGCIHRQANRADGASIELVFEQSVEGKRKEYAVSRFWSEKNGSIKDGLSVTVDGEYEPFLTQNWPEAVEGFFPKAISPLFLFDGEKIASLAEPEKAKEILKTAIWALLGLDLIDRLKSDLVQFERKQLSRDAGNADLEGLRAMTIEWERLNKSYLELGAKRASLQTDLDQTDRNLRKLESAFETEGGTLYEQRNDLEAKRITLDAEQKSVEQQLRAEAAGSLPLMLLRPEIRDLFQKIRKEVDGNQVKNVLPLFRNAVEKTVKELKTAGLDKNWVERITQLFDARINTFETPKSGGGHHFGLSRSAESLLDTLVLDTEINTCMGRVRDLTTDWERISGEMSNINRLLKAVPDVEKIAGQREELIRAREDRAAAVALLSECDNQLKVKGLDVEKAERLKARKELELSSVIALEEDATRIRESGVRVRSTLESFEKKILDKHLHRIEEEVLKCFKLLTRKKSLVERIKVDPVSFETGLFDRRDQELQTDRLSAGEGQLLSVSILWGLAKVSGWTLPTVIDTPLGRLDSVHREKLIKLYFPYAGDQVILLSQDEEIDEHVYPWLHDHISHEYALNFDDETEATSINPGYPFGGGK